MGGIVPKSVLLCQSLFERGVWGKESAELEADPPEAAEPFGDFVYSDPLTAPPYMQGGAKGSRAITKLLTASELVGGRL
ncbi:MAG: hypothetical protein C4331_16380 [Meiothermus sp.]